MSQLCECEQERIADIFFILYWASNTVETQETNFRSASATTNAYGCLVLALTVNLLSLLRRLSITETLARGGT